ncbi:SAM-dependent methyltransferase [Amycolatopsis lexingtonensis]|uniref:SAM-dependent methyltransferase n=1 Tax=Amycolatopsis lexingtonensis TaxID=218822 RepID=A0ABR9I7T7_9PSEU|nr:SAM-dependent methyltransferase [Amycolatopsis lexingtonensis]MBE1499234.1 SAM-dependent methyltransferase [Amycolatopsis lexingtonensis]
MRWNPPEVDTVDPDFLPDAVDLDRPNVARIYDWALGGTANWAIDRQYGEQAVQAFPLAKALARSNRDFLGRAVRYCLAEGITQFLDLGSGIPTAGNVHEVADDHADDSRCVYVDNEPVAVAHGRILLEETGDPGRHAVLHADLRDAREVWEAALATGVLDPDRPMCLLSVAVLHFLPDVTGVREAIRDYRRLLAPGSAYVLSHATESGVEGEELAQIRRLVKLSEKSSSPAVSRSLDEIAAFFGNFDVVEPGIVPVGEWRPEPGAATVPLASVVGGVGRKREGRFA